MEEKLVVEQAKNGDKEAFEILYKKYQGRVFDQIFKNIRNKEDTTDLVQDVFVKVYANLGKYNSDIAGFYTFVWANARKILIDYSKKFKRRSLIFENNKAQFADMPVADIIEVSASNEYNTQVQKMLDKLSRNQKMAFTLVCIDNKTYRQAAHEMNKSEVNVRSFVCRARKNLQKEIINIYPELNERISKRFIAKAIIVFVLGTTTITGLAYATYRIYHDVIVEKIFTLSEMRKELPKTDSIISRAEALDSINFYLEILGEEKVNEDDIKLVKDYLRSKICWISDKGEKFIEIDCLDGNFVSYYNVNSSLTENDITELYEKFDFPIDYELCQNEVIDGSKNISYAKKYGDIYNTFESVVFRTIGDRLEYINFNKYDYDDNEILISKEKAIEIAKENNIDVDKIELSIEKFLPVDLNEKSVSFDYLDDTKIGEVKLIESDIGIRKVWKITYQNDMTFFIASDTGECIDKYTRNTENKMEF